MFWLSSLIFCVEQAIEPMKHAMKIMTSAGMGVFTQLQNILWSHKDHWVQLLSEIPFRDQTHDLGGISWPQDSCYQEVFYPDYTYVSAVQ